MREKWKAQEYLLPLLEVNSSSRADIKSGVAMLLILLFILLILFQCHMNLLFANLLNIGVIILTIKTFILLHGMILNVGIYLDFTHALYAEQTSSLLRAFLGSLTWQNDVGWMLTISGRKLYCFILNATSCYIIINYHNTCILTACDRNRICVNFLQKIKKWKKSWPGRKIPPEVRTPQV